jgi:hypothetical protein
MLSSQDSLLGFNIFLMVPLLQAASRRTTNSNPSLEMRVTYLLKGFSLDVAIACGMQGANAILEDANFRVE